SRVDISAEPRLRAWDGDAIGMLDRDEHDQVEHRDRVSHTRHPVLDVKRLGIPMRDEIAEDIEWTPVEDDVSSTILDALERALQLTLKVLDRGALGELVSVLFEEVVRLRDEFVARERLDECLGQRGLSYQVAARNRNPHCSAPIRRREERTFSSRRFHSHRATSQMNAAS